MIETCEWTGDVEGGEWSSECGKHFIFNDGDPLENNFLFCPYCGKRIEQDNEQGE